MDSEARDRVVASMSPAGQKIYAALRQANVLTAPQMRAPTGRSDGMRPELNALLERGLIKRAGKVGTHPKRAMSYRIVPPGDIEAAAEQYAASKPKPKPKRITRAATAEARKMEAGDWSKWYRARRRLLELTAMVVQMDDMAFWEAPSEEDRERVLGAMLELSDWLDVTIASYRERGYDDDLRAKMEKLSVTNGRTGPEIETARRLADKLERKLAVR